MSFTVPLLSPVSLTALIAFDIVPLSRFWSTSDTPPSSLNTTTSVKIPNQKDLSKFQTSQDLSHSVIIHVRQSHFRVNSLILALHSSVFERLLFSGLDEIEIETSLQKLENIEEAVYTSILILHGKDVQVLGTDLKYCSLIG